MHNQPTRLMLAALAGFCLTVAASAQVAPPTSPETSTEAAKKKKAAENEEAVKLSVFEVKTDKDIGYQSTNAAEATRMNTAIEDIPMNVTVFNQQLIEDLIATDTSQLLAYEASAVKTTENDGFLARGSASVGSNFLNGFAQTSGFGSQPLANIERVEYIRGPAAVLYGSGGYGGTINRITKQPRPRAFTAARLIMSDDHSARFEIDQNTGNIPFFGENNVSFRVNGILERGYTWFGQRKRERALAPSLAFNVGPKTKLIFEYFYDWQERQASWETPIHNGNPLGFVTGDGVYRETPRRTAWISPEDYRRNTRQVTSYDLRHSFTDNLQFRSQFQWELKEQKQIETFAESAGITILKDTVLMPRRWRSLPRTTKNYRTRNEMIWTGETGPIKHRLLVGHGWQEQYDYNEDYRSPGNYGGLTGAALTGPGRLTDAQAGPLFNQFPTLTYAEFKANPQLAGFNLNNLLPLNIFDRGAEAPVPPIPNRPALAVNIETNTFLANQDYYANDVFSIFKERVFFMAGVRHTEVRRKTINYAPTGALPNKVRVNNPPTSYVLTDATTPSYGVVVHLNAEKTYTLYANLNESYVPEFRVNGDGAELEPEQGKQKEFGLRTSLFKGRISALITYFDLIQDNVTITDPVRGSPYFVQLHGQRSTGVEASVNTRITDNWLGFGGYSNTDARNDITGIPKDLSPKHKFTYFTRYNFPTGKLKGLSLNGGVIFTSDRPPTVATSHGEPVWGPIPSFVKYDAGFGYRFKLRNRYSVDVNFKVNNVFDNREIYYVASYFRYTIDPGREWLSEVRFRF